MTLYLDPALRRALKVYCAARDVELSDAIADALTLFLRANQADAIASVTLPESSKPTKKRTTKNKAEGSEPVS
ncbi:MAG: hypothetical protein HY791_39550 [Deltaproteobacteria bacterium]|nr:hypothetical protein [Deltaproteobacteria bacterium]